MKQKYTKDLDKKYSVIANIGLSNKLNRRNIKMGTILVLATISAAGMLFLIFKFGKVRRVLAFDILIDIVVTLALCMLLAGTFVGVMSALVAGTMVSATLWLMKQFIKTETLTWKGWKLNEEPTMAERMWGSNGIHGRT